MDIWISLSHTLDMDYEANFEFRVGTLEISLNATLNLLLDFIIHYLGFSLGLHGIKTGDVDSTTLNLNLDFINLLPWTWFLQHKIEFPFGLQKYLHLYLDSMLGLNVGSWNSTSEFEL